LLTIAVFAEPRSLRRHVTRASSQVTLACQVAADLGDEIIVGPEPLSDDVPPGRFARPADEDLVVVAAEQGGYEVLLRHAEPTAPLGGGRGQVILEEHSADIDQDRGAGTGGGHHLSGPQVGGVVDDVSEGCRVVPRVCGQEARPCGPERI
jgi:hypothetical protein